jgi:SagB-type dehydrogenase family enzyme
LSAIGDEYHEFTKLRRGEPPKHRWRYRAPPELYKIYEDAPLIKLPEPEKSGGMPIWEAITKRRSCREYSDEAISGEELSQLLWATQGITGEIDGYYLRAAPSAGALYPIETYLVVNHIDGLERGIYHYAVLRHALELLKIGDFRQRIASAALEQEFLARAGVVFVWSAVAARTKWKYGERGWRYIYKDVAHVCANLYLAATSLGLGCCAVGACFDDEVNELIGLDGKEETVVYLAAVGKLP